MSSVLSSFEDALGELDVPVTRAGTESFQAAIEAATDPPAVGVALEETIEDASVSLAKTDVTVDPTPVALREATTGVTAATLGIGEYGTVALSHSTRGSELVSLFVDRHVAVVRERDVVADMDAAIDELQNEFDRTSGSAILATGPSATADMGALVVGAHGPSEVHVIVLTEDDADGADANRGDEPGGA